MRFIGVDGHELTLPAVVENGRVTGGPGLDFQTWGFQGWLRAIPFLKRETWATQFYLLRPLGHPPIREWPARAW